MNELAKALSSIDGVVAVGLGGSRGLGMADENSDYDFVLFRSSDKLVATQLIVDTIKQFTDPANIRGN
jgi:predicted nucleotidyltransferase